MYNFFTFRCENCSSVIFNLPTFEVAKLEGRKFLCGCCNHRSTVDASDIAIRINGNSTHVSA